MRIPKLFAAASAGALAIGVAACGSSGSTDTTAAPATSTENASAQTQPATLNGAGSTFAAPIYMQVGSDLSDQGLTINYQGVGSGAGVASFLQDTVDFAGSDPALAPDEIKQAGDPVQIPVAFGAITVSYNLPGVDSGLKLDGQTLGDIFLGRVTKWNAPEIARLNPGVQLPATGITVVHRSDESGTTAGFTLFLESYNAQWKSQVGSDKTVKWPTGTGAKGNDGVAAAVKQTEGAIGYVEQAYALQNDFTFADVKNKSGRFVAPTLASTSAAGEGIDVPANLGINIIDSPNPAAYPIASQTFVIFHADPCKAGMDQTKAQGLKAFVTYLLGPGQETLKKLSYAPVPASLKSKDMDAVNSMTCNGQPLS